MNNSKSKYMNNLKKDKKNPFTFEKVFKSKAEKDAEDFFKVKAQTAYDKERLSNIGYK